MARGRFAQGGWRKVEPGGGLRAGRLHARQDIARTRTSIRIGLLAGDRGSLPSGEGARRARRRRGARRVGVARRGAGVAHRGGRTVHEREPAAGRRLDRRGPRGDDRRRSAGRGAGGRRTPRRAEAHRLPGRPARRDGPGRRARRLPPAGSRLDDRRHAAAGGGRSAHHHPDRGRRDRRGRVRHAGRRGSCRSLRPAGRCRRGARHPTFGGRRRPVRSGVRIGQTRPGAARPGQTRPRQARLRQAGNGPARPGEVRTSRVGAGDPARAGSAGRLRGAPRGARGSARAAGQRRARLRPGLRRRARAGPGRRPAPPNRRRGIRPDPAGSSDRGHRADEQPARDRRPPRRLGLGDRHPPHELHPDCADRRRAGVRGDRGVDGL